MKRILVTGGTGFIGQSLLQGLRQDGMEPVLFRRSESGASTSTGLANEVRADRDGLVPPDDLAGMDGIVNLAGENIGQRWSQEVKRRILTSRIHMTRRLLLSLQRNIEVGLPVPGVLINASAVGYYGRRPVGIQSEDTPSGDGYLAMVCREWEAAARMAEAAGLRVVIFRFGIVLGAGGGVLSQMARPFRWGVGGVIGSGRQYISWIHRDDLVRGIVLGLRGGNMEGAYNLTSPQPVTMAEFMRVLGSKLGRRSWTAMPAFAARLLFGEMADELLLSSQQVIPRRLTDSGHEFLFPDIEQALEEIVRHKRD